MLHASPQLIDDPKIRLTSEELHTQTFPSAGFPDDPDIELADMDGEYTWVQDLTDDDLAELRCGGSAVFDAIEEWFDAAA